eukprot:Selendium_serpulae@DN6253_c0_g1_i20.p2
MRGWREVVFTPNLTEFFRLETHLAATKQIQTVELKEQHTHGEQTGTGSKIQARRPNRRSKENEWFANLNKHEYALHFAPRVEAVSHWLGCSTLFVKGLCDLIAVEGKIYEVSTEGSPKRSGGQGDVLCGALATTVAWGSGRHPDEGHSGDTNSESGAVAAIYLAAFLTRNASRIAFGFKSRAMSATDVLEMLPEAFSIFNTTD